MSDEEKVTLLASKLRLLLDQCDFTKGACSLTDMVGACIPATVLDQCHQALKECRQ